MNHWCPASFIIFRIKTYGENVFLHRGMCFSKTPQIGHYFWGFVFVLLETGSYFAAWADLKLAVLLPPPSEWRHAPPCLASSTYLLC
jgi:hypothetical protein